MSYLECSKDLNLSMQESTIFMGAIEEVVKNGELKDFVAQRTDQPGQSSMTEAKEGNDPMVVPAALVGFEVKRVLVDSDSAVEVLTWKGYQKMGLKEQALKKVSPLYDFVNHPIEVNGCIALPVTLGDGEYATTEYVQFFMIYQPMAYNFIFGCLIMRMAKMMITTSYMKIKFPTRTGVGFISLISERPGKATCY
ncbi:hypothetical protein PVK06_039294 [Gossypium arboreum]|uniref:Uncharacterized protein n=1 Tax=Gossypium arboreum TaxID=29729 RepID=A0ABR0N2H7_GOSAR|nr:hypothetical protein PVK06_039294 [Gossypium arboreum]